MSLTPKQLFRYLLRQCDKLPQGPKQHYKFQIKQVRISSIVN